MTLPRLTCFVKAQIASAVATAVDFGITILLKEGCGFWYLFSTSAGSTLGGMTNFTLGRCWVFRATAPPKGAQAFRYLVVWCGSILLNIAGVFLLTSIGRLNYIVSKVFVSLLIGVTFNYILQKNFVFSLRNDTGNSTLP